jgi:predicted nicotinamide N-methyase
VLFMLLPFVEHGVFGFQIHRGAPRPDTLLAYKILGGLSMEAGEHLPNNRKHIEVLRHLGITLELDQQTHEDDGTVSMAGTSWQASKVLADYITNPLNGIEWRDSSVIELGSGIGTCSLAAAIMGARVVATDASSTSLSLIRANAERNTDNFRHPALVAPLLWGDQETMEPFKNVAFDIIMASDVVYFRSSRESLKVTIEKLCRPSTLVILAHTWRTEPENDEAFFQSFLDNFQGEEVGVHLLPEDYNRRVSDGRPPVSILLLRRKTQ